MSLQTIYNALSAALRGGNIALAGTTVAGLDLTLEAIGITGTNALTLTSATLTLGSTAVILTGVTSYRSFQWSATLSGVSLDPDDSARNGFTLTLQGLDEAVAWTFATSFPTLPRSRVISDHGTLPLVPSVLAPLVVATPVISVTTEPPRPSRPFLPRLQGWLVLTGSDLAQYTDYFAASRLRLDGTVDFADPLSPLITAWAAAPGAVINLPVMTVTEIGIKLQSDYADNFSLDEAATASAAAVYAKVDISKRQGLTAEVTAPLLQGDFVWPVTARILPPLTASSGLDLVLEFFGQPPTSVDLFSFPLAQTLFRHFGLSAVEIGIQPPLHGRTLGLLYASMQFQSTEDWKPTLAFITVKQIGTGWTYHWYEDGATQFVTGNAWGRILFFDDPTLTVAPLADAGSSNKIEILVTATIPDFKITGATEDEISVPIGAVLQKYLGGSGGISDNLRITRIVFEAIPTQQWLQASMMVEGIWSITLTALNNRTVTFSLDRVIGELETTQSRIYGSLTGWASIIVTADERETTKAVFVARAEYRPDGVWHFSGGLADGVLNVVDFAFGLLGIAPSVSLPDINLKALWFEYTATGADNPYSARGTLELRWQPGVLGLTLSVEATAAVARSRKTTATQVVRALAAPGQASGEMIYSGAVSGTLQVNSLAVSIGLSFVNTETVYFFEVRFKALTLRAATEWVNDTQPRADFPSLRSFLQADTRRHQIITVTLAGFTLGDVVEYLVGLANPNANYTLEAPWTFLNAIDLARFTLRIDPKEQTVALTYAVSLDLVFIELSSVGLLYDRSTGEGTVNFVLEGRFLGKRYSLADGNPLTWDAVNDSPPQIPGKGAQLLELRYLAAGQHITLRNLTRFDSVTEVLAELRQEMQPPQSLTSNPFATSQIRFDAASQWMFGVDCIIMDTVAIGVILHDPDLYGLVVSLSGAEAESLAGLSFELLYKKVTNDVGVFRARLQVPDAFRQINFGYVSISLGIITVDIFTNGNFKVDLGFPHNRDFSLSFGIEAGPFIGTGGVYFGLLDGATSRRVPAITNGTFDPVLELGLGLAVGVGRTFNKGPLKAGMYVQLVAVFEGALGWFHPIDTSAPTAIFYWARGSAGLIGKVYGTVDFKLIKVSFSVEAHALVSITFAAYRETLVELDIGVAVEAEVTILFVTVSFSFALQLSAAFTIGQSTSAPWILADDQTGRERPRLRHSAAVPRRRRPFQVAEQTRRMHLRERYGRSGLRARLAGAPAGYSLTWPDIPVFPDGAVHPVAVKMVPAYALDQVLVQWPSRPTPTNATPAYRIALLLMVENGVSTEARTINEKRQLTAERSSVSPRVADLSFNILVEGMLRWSLAALGLGPVAGNVMPGQLEELVDQLARPEAAASLNMQALGQFFLKNIEFRLSGIPSGTPPAQIGGTAFPVPPPLGWDASTGPDDSRRFDAFRMIDPSYEAGIREYFKKLEPDPSPNAASPPGDDTESMATFVFRDYFLMIARAAVQAARQIVAAFPYVVLGEVSETLATIAAAFPTVTDQYIKRYGSTVDQVADVFGLSRAELVTLNPDIAQTLSKAEIGAEVAVTLGVTPESLASGNPTWPVTAALTLPLGDIVHQIIDGETLGSIAAAFGAAVDAWLQQRTLLDQPGLLREESPFSVPYSSFVNTGLLDLGLVAALIYIRFRGTQDLHLSLQDGVPLVEWYVQAIADLNPAIEGVIRVPQAYDNLDEVVEWTVLPGDDVWRIAATFALYQNQGANLDFSAWLQEVTALNQGPGPFARVSFPTRASAIFAGETLAAIASRLPLELQSGNGWLDPAASFRAIVKSAAILRPLALVSVPNCIVTTLADETLATLAARYDLTTEDLGSRVAQMGNLLLRQPSRTFVVPHPPAVVIGGTTPTIADLIPKVVALEGAMIAGQASRYLVSGLRLPAPKDGKYDPAGAMTGLYELVGQQLVGPAPPSQCPPLEPIPRLTLTVKNFDVGATWLRLYDSMTLHEGIDLTEGLHGLNPGLTVRRATEGLIALTGVVEEIVFVISDDDTCAYYPATVLQQAFISSPQALKLYADAPVRHALQQQIVWQTTEIILMPNPMRESLPVNVMPTLWQFPTELLTAARSNASKPFALCNVDPQLGTNTTPAELTLYAWATIVDIRIRNIAGLPNTYEVFGADSTDRQLLRMLWQYLLPPATDHATIHLLYQKSLGSGATLGLTSGPVRNTATYLIKANLTTETQSATLADATLDDPPTLGDFYASLADAARFLTLLWECSVVGGGGYWLRYTSADGSPLPESIFAADGTATLSLLVTLSTQMDPVTPSRILHSFNNTALVGNAIDAAASNLFAQVADRSEVVREATVEPGNVGFSIALQKPPHATWPTIDKQTAIRQLYSLLAYQLQTTSGFNDSSPSMPVGPKPPRAVDGTLDEEIWELFQVLPIWRYAAATALPSVIGLPSPLLDPYGGISSVTDGGRPSMATTEIKLWFQDVLGNASQMAGAPSAGGPYVLPIPVGYTDPVIGVGSWPATTAFFHVGPGSSDGAPRLSSRIALQASTHLPAAHQRASDVTATANDQLRRYTTVWYQLMQPYVTVKLLTTLQTAAGGPVPLDTYGNLGDFVSGACAWLGTTSRLLDVYVDVTRWTTLEAVSEAYGVGYDGIGVANARVPLAHIFQTPPVSPLAGTDFTIPVYGIFLDNDTTTLVAARQNGVDPIHVLKDQRNTSLPLRTGIELVTPDKNYTTPPDPSSPSDPLSLAEIAVANAITIASLITRNAALTGRLRVGFIFTCDGIDVVVTAAAPDVSLEDVAATFRKNGIQYDAVMVSGANADRPGMFRPMVTLTLDRYQLGVDETLADNGSGSSAATLAPLNINTANLFLAGTALYLTSASAGGAFDETVAHAAELFGIPPAQLLAHNAGVALKPLPSPLPSPDYLAIPGHAALPLATPQSPLRLPYAIPGDATLTGIAELFLNADATQPFASLALAQANLELRGVLTGGKTIEAGGQQVLTQAGDSFATLLKRFDPVVPLADVVAFMASTAGFLQQGGLLLTPPAKLPVTRDAYSPNDVAAMYGVTVNEFAIGNSGLTGVVKAGVMLTSPLGGERPPTIVTGTADSLISLAWRFAQRGVQTTPADIVLTNSDTVFIAGGALILLPPPPAVLTARFGGPGAWSFPSAIFDLHAWIEIARDPALVDPNFRGATDEGPAVRNRASIPPVPKTLGTVPAEQYLALQAFARDLEDAVPALRAATGKLAVEGAQPTADVWGVAFGAGYIEEVKVEPGVTIDAGGKIPRYFALRPLDNAWVTRSRIAIRPLLADGTLGDAVGRDFQGIDLEIWAGRVLADIDLFGSAPYASSVYRTTQRQKLESILRSKQTLADSVSRGLDYVLDFGQPDPSQTTPPPPDWEAAREILRQRLLVSLAAGYDVDAIVQYDTRVTSPWSVEVARLSGPAQLGVGELEERRLTMSGAKTSLATTQENAPGYVSFLLDVAQEGEGRVIALDPSYLINEVEFNVADVVDGYQSSDWLQFVRRFDANLPAGVTFNLGTPEVPIPLRGYPPLPSLLAQNAHPTHAEPANYAQALLWDYEFRYQHQSAAVDQIQVEVRLNVPPLDLTDASTGDAPLFKALAQYNQVAPALWALLNKLPQYESAADKTTIDNAVATFATLVGDVANGWSVHWNAVQHILRRVHSPSAPRPETYTFRQTLDTEYDPETRLTVYTALYLERLKTEGSLGWPLMSVVLADGTTREMGPGVDTPRGRKYVFPVGIVAFGMVGFVMQLSGLPIASYQNASAQVRVVRNAHLSDLAPTRSAFVYQTRWLAFPSMITPLLLWRRPYAIGPWTWTAADNPLNAVFAVLFGSSSTGRVINCGIRYGYTLAAGNAEAITPSLPVKFRPKFTFVGAAGAGNTVAEIVTAVKEWDDREKPTTSGGTWIVTIGFFSGLDGQIDRPLLELSVTSSLPLVLR